MTEWSGNSTNDHRKSMDYYYQNDYPEHFLNVDHFQTPYSGFGNFVYGSANSNYFSMNTIQGQGVSVGSEYYDGQGHSGNHNLSELEPSSSGSGFHDRKSKAFEDLTSVPDNGRVAKKYSNEPNFIGNDVHEASNIECERDNRYAEERGHRINETYNNFGRRYGYGKHGKDSARGRVDDRSHVSKQNFYRNNERRYKNSCPVDSHSDKSGSDMDMTRQWNRSQSDVRGRGHRGSRYATHSRHSAEESRATWSKVYEKTDVEEKNCGPQSWKNICGENFSKTEAGVVYCGQGQNMYYDGELRNMSRRTDGNQTNDQCLENMVPVIGNKADFVADGNAEYCSLKSAENLRALDETNTEYDESLLQSQGSGARSKTDLYKECGGTEDLQKQRNVAVKNGSRSKSHIQNKKGGMDSLESEDYVETGEKTTGKLDWRSDKNRKFREDLHKTSKLQSSEKESRQKCDEGISDSRRNESHAGEKRVGKIKGDRESEATCFEKTSERDYRIRQRDDWVEPKRMGDNRNTRNERWKNKPKYQDYQKGIVEKFKDIRYDQSKTFTELPSEKRDNMSHCEDKEIDLKADSSDASSRQPEGIIKPKEFLIVTDEKGNGRSKNRDVTFSDVKDVGSSKPKSAWQQKKSEPSRSKDGIPENAKWQDETQRGLLIEQLGCGKYECLVCCNLIRGEVAVWSCGNCFHIYHLYCIKKWAHSPSAAVDGTANGWRCPTCQHPYLQVPNQYNCFCGKVKDPEFSRYATPHSCNETCGRERSRGCKHPCTLLCHPGPCPPCTAFIMQSCDCGKTKCSVRCIGDATAFKCGELCRRALNCGQHECQALCHSGSCEPCAVVIEKNCFCGQNTQTVQCGSSESFLPGYSCQGVCARKLPCGLHECSEKCHPGPCGDCPLSPSTVTHCYCGKTALTSIKGHKPRKTCTDPISSCNKLCEKELPCGNIGSKHRCQQKCHNGPCAVTCSGTTEVTCRCGSVTKEIPCSEFFKLTQSAPFTCDRRCKKKLSCGRHKCNQLCCISTEHKCQITCGYKLSCGLHKCEEPCHRGNCPSCWQVSFDELRCYCGAQVIYPPVPCGTKPPECNRPCTRQHSCDHKATHNCHSEDVCPPCIVLTEKWCMGHHELRHNIPCHITDISCGMPCGKELPCVIHKCLQPCHKGACLDGQSCSQPCPIVREECGHPCLAPCHQGSPCPATVCKAEMILQCECGRRKEKTQCLYGHDSGGQSDYSKMTASYVASKLWEGQSIDLTVLKKELSSKKTRKLPCNSECAIMERNQRLALALEIKNPDLSSKLGNPPYSQFLKDFAKQNSTFVANVEKALSSLVTAAQQRKVTRKSHAFKVMPSHQRRVIHELAEFYGCQTESYDEEPNKNVVATAMKDKCWLPSVTLTALVQRELFPKAPVPIPINSKEEQIRSAAQAAKQSTEVFGLSGATNKGTSGQSVTSRKNESKIDYFDFTD